jgi:hypothetical protein
MLPGLRSALSPGTIWVPPSGRHADRVAKPDQPATSTPTTGQSFEILPARVLRLHIFYRDGQDGEGEEDVDEASVHGRTYTADSAVLLILPITGRPLDHPPVSRIRRPQHPSSRRDVAGLAVVGSVRP